MGGPKSVSTGTLVQSEPNQGTTAMMPPTFSLVLVVDDDRDLCDLLAALLTRELSSPVHLRRREGLRSSTIAIVATKVTRQN
jgi:hypothetical protein